MQEQPELFTNKYPIISKPGESGATVYTVFIFQEIGAPADFLEIISLLDNAEMGDVIILKFNTPGGRLDATLSVLDAIHATHAQTVAEISGDCASAGTLIALACDGLYVAKHSEFMCHYFTGGSGGKGHEIKAHTEFMLPNNAKLMRKAYKSFLTKKEIRQLINGTDFYMGPKEIMERWDNVMDYRKKQTDKLVAADEKAQLSNYINIVTEAGYIVTKEDT